MFSYNVLTLTVNPCIDRSCATKHVAPERKLRCHSVKRQPGGGGINVARALHELGGSPLAVWTGGGDTGRRLAGMLNEEGLQHTQIETAAATRENIHLFEESSESQYRLVMPGVELTEHDAEQALATVAELSSRARYVVASGSIPPGAEDDLYARVRERLPEGVRFIVDTKGEPLRRALEAGVFLAKPNIAELVDFTGEGLHDDASIARAAGRLIERQKVHAVVVSLGRGGAMVVTQDGSERIAAPMVRARSKVGAGDSMVAGITHQLARGAALSAAVRFGVAAGAAAVLTPGTELCRRADVERLYAGMRDAKA